MNWFKKLFSKKQSDLCSLPESKDVKCDTSKKKAERLKCPDCGNDTWIQGPGGGSFGNIQCFKCKSWFNNLGPFGLNKIDK